MADDTSGIIALANKFMHILGPAEAEAKVRTESAKIQRAMHPEGIHGDIMQAAQNIDPEVLLKGAEEYATRGAYGSYTPSKEEITLDKGLENIYTSQTRKTLSHELLHFLLRHDAIKENKKIPNTDIQHRWIDAILGPGHPIEGHIQGPAPDFSQLKDVSKEERDQFMSFMQRHLPMHTPDYPEPESLKTTPSTIEEPKKIPQKQELTYDPDVSYITNLFRDWPVLK